MTETLSGSNGHKGGSAGTDAMRAVPPAERARRHEKLIRFLDSGDAGGMTIQQIADAVGISRGAVYSEFTKRRVPMTPGQRATYRLPGPPAPKRKVAPPGEAREKIQAYLETAGVGTLTQIAEATGVPRSTVGSVMAKMGLVPGRASEPEPDAPVSRKTALAEVGAMAAIPAADGEPDGKLVYLHQISDGRHAFVDLLTGRLWAPDSFRPL